MKEPLGVSMKLRYLLYVGLAVMVAVYTYETVITFGGLNTYIGDEVWYPTAAYNYLKLIFHLNLPMQYPYSNENNIQTYINPEHPPLGKYLMAISILALGYRPLAWRIPSWTLGSLLLVVAFFTGDRLYRKVMGDSNLSGVAGILASLIVASDPNLWVLHGIAMLEIFPAFFTLLTLYFIVADRPILAALTLGLDMASKETSYVLILPFLWYIGNVYGGVLKRAVYGLGVPVLTYGVLSIPIMWYYGSFTAWLRNSFLHQLSWDVQNGHISLTAISQISTPWDWFLNIHPFFLGNGLYANTDPVVLILAVALTVTVMMLRDEILTLFSMFAWTVWLGLVLVYFLGNHTLFSFYVTDFSPVLDVFVVPASFKVVNEVLGRIPIVISWKLRKP
jgi:predicted membrane-bound dolichyl-phosphate-mannose-protein mannosyltransferase